MKVIRATLLQTVVIALSVMILLVSSSTTISKNGSVASKNNSVITGGEERVDVSFNREEARAKFSPFYIEITEEGSTDRISNGYSNVEPMCLIESVNRD